MSEWVSVEDRLPEATQIVIASIRGQVGPLWYRPRREYYSSGFRWITNDVQAEGVTHWMPLPEPPETNDG